MKNFIRQLDIRDWHVYGGLIAASIGATGVDWHAGLAVLGAGLLYLGLRRPD